MNDLQLDARIQICRLCGKETENTIHILKCDIPNLCENINRYLPITITTNDILPLTSCIVCTDTLLAYVELVTTCTNAQEYLQKQDIGTNILHNEEMISVGKKEIIKKEPIIDDLNETDTRHEAEYTKEKMQTLCKLFACTDCSNTYTRKYDLEKHRRLKHNYNQTKSVKTQLITKCKIFQDGRSQYQCDICNRIFHQSYNLLRHLAIHSATKNFSCHICGKSFKTADCLNRHIKVLHDEIREFSCDYCSMRFATKQRLSEHMNTHTQNRPFVCEVCGNAFKQRVTLSRHKLLHTAVKFTYKCKLCSKMFKTARGLSGHYKSHSTDKPYQCPVCEMCFKYKNAMERHSKLHEEHEMCMCDVCGRVFKQSRYLTEHKKLHIV